MGVAHIDFEGVPRGPGTWSFNDSLLEETVFTTAVKRIVARHRSAPTLSHDIFSWYEELKTSLRDYAMFYSKSRTTTRKKQRLELAKQLTSLSRQLDHHPSDPLEQALAATDAAIKTHDLQDLKGAVIRSNMEWRDLGEQPSGYFLSLEKHRQSRRNIKSLTLADGSVITDGPSVRAEIFQYYSAMYQKEQVNPHAVDHFTAFVEGRLSAEDRDLCDGNVNWKELIAALGRMKPGRSPGADGFTVRFWRFVLPLLKAEFLTLLCEIQSTGRLPRSMCLGMVVLLPKDGDLSLLSNWRPITLLNVDRKLLAKVFSSRLALVAPSVISSCQTGSIRGRDITHTSRFVMDVMSYLNLHNQAGLILKMDLQKAYDFVDWTFLFRVLAAFGFGPYFLRWIELFLTNSSTTMKINGFLTDYFRLGRSVRQGCPLSPLLYAFSTEPLCVALNQCPGISRITLGQEACPVLFQHVDDNTLLLSSEASITAVVTIYGAYGEASGARINLTKSSAQWIGAWESRAATVVSGITISSDPRKILGLHLTPRSHLSDSLNWDAKLPGLQAILRVWSRRRLTVLGKIMVLNCLIASKLWHLARVLHYPMTFHAELKKSFLQFIWGSTYHAVDYATLTHPRILGGFGLVDLERKIMAFRLHELSELLAHTMSPHERNLHGCLFGIYGGGLIPWDHSFRLPVRPHLLGGTPPRYRETLHAWQSYLTLRNFRVKPVSNPVDENIFYNPRISLPAMFNRECFLMASAGFLRLRDLHYEVRPGFLPPDAISDQFIISCPFAEVNVSRIHRLYATIRSVLPQEWSRCFLHCPPRLISNEVLYLEHDDGSTHRFSFQSVKSFYVSLTPTAVFSNGEDRWRRFLQIPRPRVKFKTLSNSLLGSALSTTNLKLIHQSFPVKSRLVHAGLVPNVTCVFCRCAPETIEHIFLTCPMTAKCWESIFQVLCHFTADPAFRYSSSFYKFLVFHNCVFPPGHSQIFWIVACLFISIVKTKIWKYRCFIIVEDASSHTVNFSVRFLLCKILITLKQFLTRFKCKDDKIIETVILQSFTDLF